MIFPVVTLFALVAAFITPILSAPVPMLNSNVELTEPHFLRRTLGSHHHGMSYFVKRDGSSVDSFAGAHSPPVHTSAVRGVAESRLTKVRENETRRLVRRTSIGAKIKGAFQVSTNVFQSRYTINTYHRKLGPV
jgi:hypothetical protein